MSNGQTGRRSVLSTGGVALLAGLTGCTGVLSGSSDSERQPGSSDNGRQTHTQQEMWDFLQYLPSESIGNDGGLALTHPAAVRRDQVELTAKKSAQILKRAVGESGWIPDTEIDHQIMWTALNGWGYAFRTPLEKSEIISRYKESHLREHPVGTYDGYTLFERSSSWHAVSENEVIKVPSRDRAVVESYLDGLDRDRTPVSDIQLILDELDSRYSLTVNLFGSTHREFNRSGITHYGYCRSVSPNPDADEFTLTAGILTDSPERLAEWATEKNYVFFDKRQFSSPTVRATDNLVLLTETGTTTSFDGYI